MPHPLDPLSAAEITEAVKQFRNEHSSEHAFFSSAGLLEPPKASVKAGADIPRTVRLLGVDETPDGGFVADVNLSSGAADIRRLPGNAQVAYSFVDIGIATEITKRNTDWLAAVAKRGVVTDSEEAMELIQIDPWPAGGYAHPDIPEGHRAMRCIAFVREDATDNGYAKPIHGLIAHVDLTAREVVVVEDHGVVPLPKASGRFDRPVSPSMATTLSGRVMSFA